jgi:rod shape-determining protein MreD
MRLPAALGLAVLFVVLVVLHYSLRPLLDWRAPADFLVIGVLLVSVRVRTGTAAVFGLLAGLVADALAPSAFGASALAFTIVGAGASWLKEAFFGEHVALNAAFLVAGKLAFDIVYLMAEGRLTGSDLLWQIALWSSLSAIVTALTGLAVMLLFRPLLEPAGHRR